MTINYMRNEIIKFAKTILRPKQIKVWDRISKDVKD